MAMTYQRTLVRQESITGSSQERPGFRQQTQAHQRGDLGHADAVLRQNVAEDDGDESLAHAGGHEEHAKQGRRHVARRCKNFLKVESP
jgi:hypothetical protein